MDARISRVAEHLLLIERELLLLGWWTAQPPAEEALSSQQPFCVDTLAFEQWLQWIFLPRMKQIIEQNEPLPAVSAIKEMGEMAFAGRSEQTGGLLELLGAFDQLIAGS